MKSPRNWWENLGAVTPINPYGGAPGLAHSGAAPYGHGKMLLDKARLYSAGIDPYDPTRTKARDTSLFIDDTKGGRRSQDMAEIERSFDGRKRIEDETYSDRAPMTGGRSMMTSAGERPDGALAGFWVANPDTMWVSEARHNNIIRKKKTINLGPMGMKPEVPDAKVWKAPTVVFDEGEICCGDGCASYVGRPFCVTEAEVRRYFENVDHVPPPDLINCAASDSNVCDSIHGDARDQDDHWGRGWLDAMRNWHIVNGPLPNRDELQREKVDSLAATPGGRKLFAPGPKAPPDYFPPDYDSSANTTSYAVFSVTGMSERGLPPFYRSEKMDDNLTQSDGVVRNQQLLGLPGVSYKDSFGWYL